jgi:hypothetical protein
VDTALALLFLNRATAPVSGDERSVEWRLLVGEGDLNVRGRIGDGVEVWLTGLSKNVRADQGLDDDADLTIESVQWIARSGGVETVLATLDNGGSSERFAERIKTEFPGPYELFARASILAPASEKRFDLDSAVLNVPTLYTSRQLDYGGDSAQSLLRGATITATSGKSKPTDAVDGDQNSNWICEASDLEPMWSAELPVATRAATLLITHRGPRPTHSGLSLVSRVRLVINGSDMGEFELQADLMKKTEIALDPDVRVKRVELYLLDFTGSADSGFSEIELMPSGN